MRRLLSLLFVFSFAPAVLAQSADLSISISIDSTTIYQQGEADGTGKFTITNAGPSIAKNVVVDFDSSVTTAAYFPGFDTCDKTSGHFRCTAVSLAPGSFSGGFAATWVQAPNGTVETVTATIASSSPDPNTANNSSSANTTVVWQANLQLLDVQARSAVAPGMDVYVTAHYSNFGPSPAADFKLTIPVPAGTSFEKSFATSGLTCAGPPIGAQGNLVCTANIVGNVSGFSVTALVRVDPAAAFGTVVTFPVTLTSSTATTPSQTKSASLTVVQAADLHAAVSAPATVMAADTFLTTITLTNDGPGPALDASIAYVQGDFGQVYGPISGPPGWVCTATMCKTSSFAPGTATFTSPTSTPYRNTSLTLTGTAIANAPNDPNPSNDTANASTTVTAPPQATLAFSLTAAPDIVHNGDQVTYTARITNTSTADAQNVNLVWTLPGAVVASSCGSVSDPICSLATVAAGTTLTVTRTISVNAGVGTVLPATAKVTALNVTYDWVAHSASASITVAGSPHPDLAATITAPATIRAGTTSLWTYTVYNGGPDAATDWQFTVTLPPGTTLDHDSYAGQEPCTGLTPNALSSTVTCHGTYIAVQSVFTLQLWLEVAPGTVGPLHATATASTANADPNLQNNNASADTRIVTSADLSASMTTDKTAAVFGERVTQTLTITNKGPDTATGIVAEVGIPGSGLSVSSTFAACSRTTPIRCTQATLGPGATLTVTVAFDAPANAGESDSFSEVFWDNALSGTGDARAEVALRVIAPDPPPPAPTRRRAARH
jgi:uncharacterized repeat protein (TIGR01451 family)